MHGSAIAKITLSKILKMSMNQYIGFVERKINGFENYKEKRVSFFAKVIPANENIREPLKTNFQMFFTPSLKGETSENQPPFRVRGKADFQFLEMPISFSENPGHIFNIEVADERLIKQYPLNGQNNEVIVKMINTRNKLSEHIVRGIIEFQKKFWETGDVSYIKPLTLKKFILLYPHPNLDESRLSRLGSVLLLQTCLPCLPARQASRQVQSGKTIILKNLFISKRRFYANVIKNFIDESDKALTDNDIQTILKKQYDIHISVRTICECRKLLSIPNFRERSDCCYPNGVSFSNPIALISKTINRIPAEQGIYELCLSTKIPYPKCSSRVIYIGSSENLRRRITNYKGKVLKNKRIAEFIRNDNVSVRHHLTADYIKLEKELLKNFKKHYGQLPKGNKIGAIL